MDYQFTKDYITMKDSCVNLIQCIGWFDKGYDRIYITDDQGCFYGMVIEKESFFYALEDSNKFVAFLDEGEYIIN